MARFVGLTVGIMLILMGIMLGGELHLFIDYPSLAITVGGGFAFCFAVHSPADLKAALRAAHGNAAISREEFQHHDAVLETFSNTTLASGAVGTLIGVVNMLANMDDPKSLGPACAVAVLTVLYAAIISGMIIMPLRGRMKKRVDAVASAGTGPSAAVPVTLIFFTVIMVMLILPIGIY